MEEGPEQMVREMSLVRLADVLNQASRRLSGAEISDPVWHVYAAVSCELRTRLAPHYGGVADAELAAVFSLCLGRSPQGSTGMEDLVLRVVEDEMRSRFPRASVAADNALAEVDEGSEHDCLKVLLRESGVQF